MGRRGHFIPEQPCVRSAGRWSCRRDLRVNPPPVSQWASPAHHVWTSHPLAEPLGSWASARLTAQRSRGCPARTASCPR